MLTSFAWMFIALCAAVTLCSVARSLAESWSARYAHREAIAAERRRLAEVELERARLDVERVESAERVEGRES